MKRIVLLVSVFALLTTVGCQTNHDQSHMGGAYGGTYEGSPGYQSQGQGEYLGYPNYPEYRDY